jgi:hypothetical protein
MGIRAAIALGISNEIVETDSSVALETARFALVAIGAIVFEVKSVKVLVRAFFSCFLL